MDISEEKFVQRKAEAKVIYDAIGSVKCPYFNGEEVHFNSEGFEHILFKSWNKTRSRVEQYTRLRLIPLVVSIIRKSGTLQEYDEKNIFVRQQSRGKWTEVMKLVRYYIFIAIINDLRMKIIVREVVGEKKRFYSVYPSWSTAQDGWGGKKKKLYTGNPETD